MAGDFRFGASFDRDLGRRGFVSQGLLGRMGPGMDRRWKGLARRRLCPLLSFFDDFLDDASEDEDDENQDLDDVIEIHGSALGRGR
jgi:hypothetical protein